MGRLGIRIANVALFVGSCVLSAGVFNQIASELLAPPPARASLVSPQQEQTAKTADSRVILDRNLFGSQLTDPAPMIEEPPEEDVSETELPLRLLGTAASGDDSVSMASIENKTTRKHEALHVGDTLSAFPDVTVERIERRRIVLRNGARLEELVLEEVATGVSSSSQQVAATRNRSSRRGTASRRRSNPDLAERLAKLRQDTAKSRSPASIFSQAQILPKYEDGEMIGIQLNKIKADSLYEKIGLVDGDIITTLNGIDINNPAASAKILGELTGAEELVLTKLGADGSEEQLTVGADQLSEMLE